jgi:uncharacterized protein
MRDVLQGFTCFFDGVDHGIDCEEIGIPTPKVVTQEYRGGGMDLAVNQGLAALEPLEATFKFAGHARDILARVARGPGKKITVTARGAVMDVLTGETVAHVAIMTGELNDHSRDNWKRAEKGGIEVTMNGMIAYRYEIGGKVIHDVAAYPPRRVINEIDELAAINSALGYANG